MGRRGSKGSKERGIRHLSLGEQRRILADAPSSQTNTGSPHVPEPESLASFYSRLREGNKLPFTLNQLGVVVDRATGFAEEKAIAWFEQTGRKIGVPGGYAEIFGHPIVRAAWLDLSLMDGEVVVLNGARINFGPEDGIFHPGRLALASAVCDFKNLTPRYT